MTGNAPKRLFDFTLAASALILLSPLFAVIAVLVAIDLGRPVLFRQVRPGQHGQPFTIYKFRTMRSTTDAWGSVLPDAARLTPLGRILRRTSLDELPELVNVLRGEMSLVGPRPLLMEYLPYFTVDEARRFAVLPGITGWAQVNGRNLAAWDRRLALDVWYVDHRSLPLDLKILAMTVHKVLAQENALADPTPAESNLKWERSGQRAAAGGRWRDAPARCAEGIPAASASGAGTASVHGSSSSVIAPRSTSAAGEFTFSTQSLPSLGPRNGATQRTHLYSGSTIAVPVERPEDTGASGAATG